MIKDVSRFTSHACIKRHFQSSRDSLTKTRAHFSHLIMNIDHHSPSLSPSLCVSSSSRRPSYDQYHEDGSKHIETWTHVSKPAVVLSCEICASKNRKLQSRPPAGLEYVKKKHSRCGHYYFELTTCRSIFLKKAYESGVIL